LAIVTRPPSVCGLGTLEAEAIHVQPSDERIDHSAHVVGRNEVI
jgi:hypothetical protein